MVLTQKWNYFTFIAGVIEWEEVLPKIQYHYMPSCEIEWDYRIFDIKSLNTLLKSDIQRLQEAYEEFDDWD